MDSTWTKVDEYFEHLFVGEDEALTFALENSRGQGLPTINVSPCQGRLLHILAVIAGARRVLEVGTLGGYSTICLARAVGTEGEVVTIEASPQHAEVAARNIHHAGCGDRVQILQGDARDVLRDLVDQRADPFDLVFLDADKEGNPIYLQYALQLARPGTVIIGDNVVRGGRVVDAACEDADVVGTRRFCQDQGADDRLLATAVQTVGIKGHDGFTMAVVKRDVGDPA